LALSSAVSLQPNSNYQSWAAQNENQFNARSTDVEASEYNNLIQRGTKKKTRTMNLNLSTDSDDQVNAIFETPKNLR